MRKSATAIAGLVLLGIGYSLGAMHGNSVWAFAEDDKEAVKTPAAKKDAKKDEGPKNPALSALSEETQAKLKAAATALKAAQDQLMHDKKYNSATKGMNVTSILVGGIDSRAELESTHGVDPETFCALYANMAEDSVAQHLTRDEEGRLKYKDRVIRMYSIDRLKRMYANRAVITGEEIPLTAEETAAKEREAKKSSPTPKADAAKDAPKADDAKKEEEKKEEEKK